MTVVRVAIRVLVWMLLISALLAVVAAVLAPRIGGGTPYTVLTGSMRPDLPPGTLVVTKPVETSKIAVGDVITYQIESGEATVVTHRVIAVATRLDGETVFTTQGDANDVPDPEPVLDVQVRGRLWYSVPYLGHVNNALNGRQRQTAVLVVSTALLGYAAFMLVGAIRDRRRRTGHTDELAVEEEKTYEIEEHAHHDPVRSERPSRLCLAAGVVGAVVVLALLRRFAQRRHS